MQFNWSGPVRRASVFFMNAATDYAEKRAEQNNRGWLGHRLWHRGSGGSKRHAKTSLAGQDMAGGNWRPKVQGESQRRGA